MQIEPKENASKRMESSLRILHFANDGKAGDAGGLESQSRFNPVRQVHRFSRKAVTEVILSPVSCGNNGDDEEDEDEENEQEKRREEEHEEEAEEPVWTSSEPSGRKSD
jgi:hypothetical protein